MKSLKLLACLLAFSAVAVSAMASRPGVSLGFGAQYWDAKDADKLDKDGLEGGSVILRLRPSEYLGIDIRGGAVGVWKSDHYRVNGTKYETDATFYCVPVEAALLLMLPLDDNFTLYAGPGAGYYYYDIDIKTTSKHHHHYHTEWKESVKLEDDVGWFAVAGLNIQLTSCFSIFGEARYTDT